MAEAAPLLAHQCQSYGIFWDIENCPIPNRADAVVKNLKQFISSKYESIVGAKPEPCAFVCACNTIKLEQMHVEVLNRSGVDILHVNPTRPNQNFKVVADDKLKECIQKFIEHHSNVQKSLIFVITGDVDFAPQIRTARRAGFQVILLYGAQTSAQLKDAVDEAHSYHDVVSGSLVANQMDLDFSVPSSSQRHGGPLTVNINGDPILRNDQPEVPHGSPSRRTEKSLKSGVSGVPPFIEQVMNNVSQMAKDIKVKAQTAKQTNVRTIDEAKLGQLQELTGLERHLALQILENTNWDVEMAVNVLYN